MPDWVPATVAVRETPESGATPNKGTAMRLTESVGAAVTVRVNVVVRVSEPAVPVTVTGYAQAGVDGSVVMARLVVQVGIHDIGTYVADVPIGRPDVENDADCDAPDERVAVMVLDTLWPWVTDLDPPLVREKLNTGAACVVPFTMDE